MSLLSLTLSLITDVLMELLTGHFSLSLVFKSQDTVEKLPRRENERVPPSQSC